MQNLEQKGGHHRAVNFFLFPQLKTNQKPDVKYQETLETQSTDNAVTNPSADPKPSPYMQNLGQTSASNMSSALSSITQNYASAQPKTQITSQTHLQNQPQGYGGESYYSSTNYTSAKSPRSNVAPTTKQTFFKMPESKEKLDTKKPLGGIGGGDGVKKYATPSTTTSNTKLPGSNLPSTGSRGGVSFLYF